MEKKQEIKYMFFALLRGGGQRVKSFFIHAGDGTLIALWGTAFSLILLLLFLCTTGLRAERMREKANLYLSKNGYGRILIAPVSAWRINGEAMNSGFWWIVGREDGIDKTENYGVIISVLQNGIFAPFLGIALENGDIELIPLTESAKITGGRMADGMLDIYKRRASAAVKKIIERRSVVSKT